LRKKASLKASRLAALPPGQRVFIDSNIFVYHFTAVSTQCTELLDRCEQGDLLGVTGTNVLLEVMHRLMMVEAVVKKLITPGNLVRKLREKPQIVKQLRVYQEQTAAILEMGLEVLAMNPGCVAASARYRQDYGLLVNDSMTVALASAAGIRDLASSDRDFAGIDGLALYSPTDVITHAQSGRSRRG
jgi:predicted nucleic acid-binding protein